MFVCDKCGECCRHLDISPLYSELHNGDGVCIFLRESLCSIYDSRPLICRVDECYNAYFKDEMTYEDYIRLNHKCCQELKKLRRN